MKSIVFIDTEIEPKSQRILDIGAIKSGGNIFHKTSLVELALFLNGVQFVAGHNIFNHDLKYIENVLHSINLNSANVIDTLYLSPLLFPANPYHALLKDDKLQTDELNNPVNDSVKAKDLFFDEVSAFAKLDDGLKKIIYSLLGEVKEFKAFFRFIGFNTLCSNLEETIRTTFHGDICEYANLSKFIGEYPVELAYSLSLINTHSRYSITPPWVLKNYPHVEQVMFNLRNNPCLTGCIYCNKALDAHLSLKRFFGYDNYRSFGGEPLQENAVKAAIAGKSLLAVFPTGGGKSLAFQVPALMSGENAKGLTVVISPLQSLMKDQVDNLEKVGITDAVTINGLLDPIERAKSYYRIENGRGSILYISPESLRSRLIERLLLERKVVRFVIDEAHCLSSWGQDFRVDYLYIGDFIKSFQKKKNLEEPIPVSCFTATAKPKVIDDIREYFYRKLGLDLELYISSASRTNLQYKVLEKNNEEDKYQKVRALIEAKNCPTIIYVSRTRKAYQLAERLTADGFDAKPYHGRMEVKEKTENQNAFIAGDVSIMVATSAFGMGVDKKDVGMVIHYEISDSLENYIQEAGRAGRDEEITADCYVLFNEDDLSKHFILLNQTKLSIKEIQQVWRAIKEITRFRDTVSNSALEIARKAGWDDDVADIETRVRTAISALEESGYLKRGQNMPMVFANSILAKNAQEAIDKITASPRFSEKQKVNATRIIKKLFSSKSRKHSNDEMAESRIDYISDHLGIVKGEVISIINLLREEKILADTKDLTAFIRRGEAKNRSLGILKTHINIEKYLLDLIDQKEQQLNIKELNEGAEESSCSGVTPNKIRTIINFWAIKNWVKHQNVGYTRNHLSIISNHPKEWLKEKLERRVEVSEFIVEYLFEKSLKEDSIESSETQHALVEFSVHELKDAFEKRTTLFKVNVTIEDIEDSLFYLSRIDAIKIEGGFLVLYNRLTIERLEKDNRRQYRLEDYEQLSNFYEHKIQQIHIVGEYAKRMLSDYKDALQFVEDYFQLNYTVFLQKYFKGSRKNEIKRNITPTKFKQLFGELSPAQLKIINDNESRHIVVAAGPGSGKTRVLVHKLASLLLMEDVKHEQLLMVTFSRAAATEFKKRLYGLIGNAAAFIEIKTFHSYCFDLLGKIGSIERSEDVVRKAAQSIRSGEVEINRITKTVLVIDEAQDMDQHEFNLIQALMEKNEEMRVIAVGDDDQNIFEFRGASSKYLEQFIVENKAVKYELIENYRSKSNLVDFSNQFVNSIQKRLKSTPIVAKQADNGRIRIIRYDSKNLTIPLVNDVISSELIGTTCVLTHTNEEALHATGLLLKNQIQAKLIQTNDQFNLYNLAEVRFFVNRVHVADDVFTISQDVWENAKRELNSRFSRSNKLEICTNLIRDFEQTNPRRKYKTDLEVFIRESKLEDFFNEQGETIFVSTVHKAKGKEFDNVFLLLDGFNVNTDEVRRQLYVAMTRAKRNLSIHINSSFLNHIKVEELYVTDDTNQFSQPNEISLHLNHGDVWLSYFEGKQYLISELRSGDALIVSGKGCLDSKRREVLKFSKRFQKQIAANKERGYMISGANVNFIIYWYQEEKEQEIQIILPEVIFERK